MKEIYANFDGLDLSFFGRISEETLKILEAAKEEAQQTRGDVGRDLGGVPVLVAETGARGGFAYTVKTGEDGETWFFRGRNNEDGSGNWAVRVSVNSGAFAQHGGLRAVRDRLAARLEAFGFEIMRDDRGFTHSVGRVDFAVDFLTDGAFAIDPDAVSFRGGKTDHFEGELHWRGRRCTGLRIGKMPNRQVVIYDKTADIAAKRKDYWWQVWGLDRAAVKEAGQRVWRIEIRAGKKHLKEVWGLVTVEDIEAAIGDVFADALDKVRLVRLTDSNITRCPDAPIWSALRAAVGRGLEAMRAGLAPGTVRAAVKERFKATMEGLLRGVALTYAAVRAERITVEQLKALVDEAAQGVMRQIEKDTESALQHAARARSRYRLIEWDEWQETMKARPVPGWLSGRSGCSAS